MKSILQSRCRAPGASAPCRLLIAPRRSLRLLHAKDPASKYDKKVKEANKEWAEKAQEIRDGKKKSMLSILEERGFVNELVGSRETVENALTDQRIGAYVGVDPTAHSIHLGNLLPMMPLLWMYLHGYEAVTILGGATAAIGDPSGRTKSREQMPTLQRRKNMALMHVQLSKLWVKMQRHAQRHGWEQTWAHRRNLFNNNEWLQKVSVYDFLSKLAPSVRVGPLLGRDTVRTKLQSGAGLSFAELAYPLVQGWDWFHLLRSRGVSMQIGGADQLGNLLTGRDSVNHLKKMNMLPQIHKEYKEREIIGMTVPLLTTSSGEKFGKSAGNAIWLDPESTPPIELYQFLLRTADDDVERYLRLFTLLPMDQISQLMETHKLNQSARVPQRKLASELVSLVHGYDISQKVEQQLSTLYSSHATTQKAENLLVERDNNITPDSPNQSQVNAENAPGPRAFLPRSTVINRPFSHVLHAAELTPSKAAAQRLISSQGAYVGSQPWKRAGGMGDSLKFTPILSWAKEDTERFIIDGSLLILRVGKWRVKIIELLDDEEYVAKGLKWPKGAEMPPNLKELHGTGELDYPLITPSKREPAE